MVSKNNIWKQLVPLEEFGTFLPAERNVPTMEVCVKMDEKGDIPGIYRFAFNSKSLLTSRFIPSQSCNAAELLGLEFSFCFGKEDINFITNSSITQWIDVLTELEKDTVTISSSNPEHFNLSHPELRPIAIAKMKEMRTKGKGMSLRFELNLDEEGEITLQLRSLPASAEFLTSHTFLSQPDIGTQLVEVYDIKFTNFSRSSGESGFAPVLCANSPTCSNEKLWQTAVFSTDSIKQRIPNHGVLTNAEDYIKKPGCVSPNTFTWKQHVRASDTKKRKVESGAGDHDYADRGIANPLKTTNCKFGPDFDLNEFEIATFDNHVKLLIDHALSRSSWSHYRSAWKAFAEFQSILGTVYTWPLSNEIVTNFVSFLFYNRQIKLATIYVYLSGLRFLHKLKNVTVVFDSNVGSLALILTGIKNYQSVNDMGTSIRRRVITFPVLKLLGHEIFSSDFNKFEKIVIVVGLYACVFHML